MDIRKLQRAIVDGLEDVKGQNISVFNTEHLSPLFERVIIASGTSNRQTKALAASVRDAVKSGGFGVMRTEGEENGEWIIVDCGAAVVHLMQPAIREYYHLEEIWGDKPVKLKLDTAPLRLVKAEEPAADAKPAVRQPAGKTVAGKKASPARKRFVSTSASRGATGPASAGAAASKAAGTVARKSAASTGPVVRKAAPSTPAKTQTLVVKPKASAKLPAKKAAAKKVVAKKAAAKTPARKTPR